MKSSFSTMMNYWMKQKTIVPLDKEEEESSSSPIMSPETVLVRPNPHIPGETKEEEEDQHDQHQQQEEEEANGREVRYEAKVLFSPVYVSTRPSTSDKALKSKRLLVTKDGMDEVTTLLNDLAIEGEDRHNDNNETSPATTTPVRRRRPSKTSKSSSPSHDMQQQQEEQQEELYGSFTKTIRLPSSSEKVQVRRSRRLS